MCYHISFESKLESIEDFFPGIVIEEQTKIDFTTSAYIDGFTHPMVNVVVKSRKNHDLHLTKMMWGLLPAGGVQDWEAAKRFWNGYKNEEGVYKTGFITLDAVGEELLQKKLYAAAAKTHRCILLVNGFYEWHHHFPVGKRGERLKTAVKYPHHIGFKNIGYPFQLCAAIWNPWRHTEVDEQTGEVKSLTTPTVSMLTTKANTLMSKIHNSKKRMPTFLTKELAEEWLSDGLSDERITEIATTQFPAEQMEAFSIKKDFQKIQDPKERDHYPEIELDVC